MVNRPCIRVTAVEQQSSLVYVGNLPGRGVGGPDATKSVFLLSPFGDSFWWFPEVLLYTSSRCLWRNRRKTSPHLVAPPASRSVCGTVASRVFAHSTWRVCGRCRYAGHDCRQALSRGSVQVPAKGVPQAGTEGATAGLPGNISGIKPPPGDFSSMVRCCYPYQGMRRSLLEQLR